MKVKDLKVLLESVDEELEIATLDHFGKPEFYDECDFGVEKTHESPPRKVFGITAMYIGPEPD